MTRTAVLERPEISKQLGIGETKAALRVIPGETLTVKTLQMSSCGYVKRNGTGQVTFNGSRDRLSVLTDAIANRAPDIPDEAVLDAALRIKLAADSATDEFIAVADFSNGKPEVEIEGYPVRIAMRVFPGKIVGAVVLGFREDGKPDLNGKGKEFWPEEEGEEGYYTLYRAVRSRTAVVSCLDLIKAVIDIEAAIDKRVERKEGKSFMVILTLQKGKEAKLHIG